MGDKKEYIERGALLKTPPFTKYGGDLSDAYTEGYLDCAEDARMAVKCVHAADVEEVMHGEWKKRGNEKKCSVCDFIYYSNNDEWTFCPNCGAHMDGERKEQT